MKFVDAGHTYAPADKRRDRIRVLGRSSFRTDLKVGNGTAQWSNANLQPRELKLAQRAKTPQRSQQGLFEDARRCLYTAEHFAGSVTCSRIEGTTSPLNHIENPSGGSILFRPRLAVAEAQNTRVPAPQAVPATPRQHKIWSSVSSPQSVPLCLHLTQQSPKVPQLLARLAGPPHSFLITEIRSKINHDYRSRISAAVGPFPPSYSNSSHDVGLDDRRGRRFAWCGLALA
jgi:hypothetical protein